MRYRQVYDLTWELMGNGNYLDLTFQGHPRSKVMVPNESPYATSYMSPIVTICLR